MSHEFCYIKKMKDRVLKRNWISEKLTRLELVLGIGAACAMIM